jgi:hypothetical protein
MATSKKMSQKIRQNNNFSYIRTMDIKKHRFKINLLATVVGTNLSVLLFSAKIDAAIFAMITIGTLAYIFTHKEK